MTQTTQVETRVENIFASGNTKCTRCGHEADRHDFESDGETKCFDCHGFRRCPHFEND